MISEGSVQSSSRRLTNHAGYVSTKSWDLHDENDRSVVLKLRFGQFDALFGGDLQGELGSTVHNVEQRIAADVGQVELYKVHHHGSATSSSAFFMSFIRPKVATMSMSATNGFGHPTATALHNIHTENTIVYWTTAGNGAPPGPLDVVANGAIIHGGESGWTDVHGSNQHDISRIFLMAVR